MKKKITFVFVIFIVLITISFYAHKVIFPKVAGAYILSIGQHGGVMYSIVYVISRPAMIIEDSFYSIEGYFLNLKNENIAKLDLDRINDLNKLDCYGYDYTSRNPSVSEEKEIREYAEKLNINDSDISKVCKNGNNIFIVSGNFKSAINSNFFNEIYLNKENKYKKIFEFIDSTVEKEYYNGVANQKTLITPETYYTKDKNGNFYVLIYEGGNEDSRNVYFYDSDKMEFLKISSKIKEVNLCDRNYENCEKINISNY